MLTRRAPCLLRLAAFLSLAVPACSTPIVGTDAGPPDAPISPIDSGPGTPDAGPDAGPRVDTGPADPDTGPVTIDGGPTGTDAGPTTTDAGPTGTDAGPTGTDAGPTGTDAGPSGTDSGPGIDAGPGADAGGPCGGAPFGTFYRDLDGDGHGTAASGTSMRCAAGAGFVASDDDCDDSSATRYTGATEACNGIDDDCDTSTADVPASACPYANGTGVCLGGSVCSLASCTAPFDDCDAAEANGCETDTRVSAAHCGACGSPCGAADTCSASSCAGSAIVEVDVGYDSACVRRANGRVACWGESQFGALGTLGMTGASLAVEVPGITDAIGIDVGQESACAVRATGEVWCWGYNSAGALGERRDPGSVGLVPGAVAGVADAVEVAMGVQVTCARRASGRVLCWGDSAAGRLGDGGVATGNFVPPTGALGLLDAVEIYTASTSATTCARRAGGSVVCWGGGGCYGDRPMWPTSTPALTGATAIAMSTNTVCRAAGAAALVCASPPECGGGFLSDPAPAPSGVSAMSGGYNHMCVSFGAGGVSCWGANSFGQLGRNFTSGLESAPAAVVGLGATVALGGDGETTCAVSSTSAVRCWGWNNNWFVGVPSGAMITPVLIVGL